MKIESTEPLVSCLMPTKDRRRFVPRAIADFRRQDYPNRELLIVDDGSDPVADLVPDDPRIRYLRLDRRLRLGAKRNLACREARGEILVHWDDDDWHAPWRLSYQVRELRERGAELCGLDRLTFYDPAADRAWQYVYPPGGRRWLAGGTLCYTRSLWQHHPFPDVTLGEDNRFVRSAGASPMAALDNSDFYVALIHSENTSRKRPAGRRWRRCSSDRVRALLGDDRVVGARPDGQTPAAETSVKPESRNLHAAGDPPLVSCIMPTTDARRAFVPQAIRYFLRQDYLHKELLIVDDGVAPVADLVPDDPRLVYLPVGRQVSLGAKRNLAITAARGGTIAHWDDDDWYRSDYLTRIVGALCATGDPRALAGMSEYLVYLSPRRELKVCRTRGVAGATFCYHRGLWYEKHFRDVATAEDFFFLKDAKPRIVGVGQPELFMIVRHGGNTWQRENGTDVDRRLGRLRAYSKSLERAVGAEDARFYLSPRQPPCQALRPPEGSKATEAKGSGPQSEHPPQATIGILVGGEWEFLGRTLLGLARNTTPPYELRILDGDACHRLEPGAVSFPDHWRRGGDPGPGRPHSANRLIASTETPCLVLLECGAYPAPGWLRRLLAALAARPEHGIAGPSTSWAWNEQQVVARPRWTEDEIEAFARRLAAERGDEIVPLDRLHGVADFCYAFKRQVVEQIGLFDERYGHGPCFEIDYGTRAARAGFVSVWARGAYVHRFPPSAARLRRERTLEKARRELYQRKLCGLQLKGERRRLCGHCLGEECEHFAPGDLLELKLPRPQPAPRVVAETRRPVVSCIMPTYNRRMFVPQAIRYFLRQDYPRKELVIVDDGSEAVADLIPDDERVRYLRLERRASIGRKRNLAVESSRGEIIVHWDDDDWYAPHRLRHQLEALLGGEAGVCGLVMGHLLNIVDQSFWSCTPELHARMFYADVHGGSIAYRKAIWQRYGGFPDTSQGEDAAFLRKVAGRVRIARLANDDTFVYVRHDQNAWELICGQSIDPSAWQRVDPPAFLADDFEFYAAATRQLAGGGERRKRILRTSEPGCEGPVNSPG